MYNIPYDSIDFLSLKTREKTLIAQLNDKEPKLYSRCTLQHSAL